MGKKARIKLETGTVYQKEEGGTYYFRYQIKHERKCVSLKTQNQEEALGKAKGLLPIVLAKTEEVISAHVKVARNLAAQTRPLALKDAWKVYSVHPNRAFPATRHEELSYENTFMEFIRHIGEETQISAITPSIAESYSSYLKTTAISVATHNRKIQRIRKIFSTLKEYYSGLNPFQSNTLRRKSREEQGSTVRRLAFTKEQEDAIRKVLDDPKFRVINKPELKVVYYIGMYTGQRLKDCVLLQWDHVDLARRRIFVKQFKTGKAVSIPIAEPLQIILTDALQWKTNNYVCPNVAQRYLTVNAKGKSVGDNFVNIDVLRVIKRAGLETSVEVPGRKRKMTVYGFHSLRHSFASFCAEAGVPKAVVVSILGANSEIIDQFYTHVGEEAQEKAIAAITGETVSRESDAERRNAEALKLLEKARPTKKLLDDLRDILTGRESS